MTTRPLHGAESRRRRFTAGRILPRAGGRASYPVIRVLTSPPDPADAWDIMARLTRSYRQARTKFQPEYARWVWVEEAPSGVRSGPAEPPAQRNPVTRRMGKVVLASGIVDRWAVVAPTFAR